MVGDNHHDDLVLAVAMEQTAAVLADMLAYH